MASEFSYSPSNLVNSTLVFYCRHCFLISPIDTSLIPWASSKNSIQIKSTERLLVFSRERFFVDFPGKPVVGAVPVTVRKHLTQPRGLISTLPVYLLVASCHQFDCSFLSYFLLSTKALTPPPPHMNVRHYSCCFCCQESPNCCHDDDGKVDPGGDVGREECAEFVCSSSLLLVGYVQH